GTRHDAGTTDNIPTSHRPRAKAPRHQCYRARHRTDGAAHGPASGGPPVQPPVAALRTRIRACHEHAVLRRYAARAAGQPHAMRRSPHAQRLLRGRGRTRIAEGTGSGALPPGHERQPWFSAARAVLGRAPPHAVRAPQPWRRLVVAAELMAVVALTPRLCTRA